MANCNCYKCNNSCAPTNCTPECTCTSPDYSSLGCIENKTECIIFNGDDIDVLGVSKHEDMNAILVHLGEVITALNATIADLQDQLDAMDVRVLALEAP